MASAEQPGSQPESPEVVEVHCVLHDGYVTFVGSNATDVSGFAPEHFHGRHVSAIVHPDDLVRVERYLSREWTGAVNATFRVQNADGRWNWRLAHGTRTVDDEGNASAVVVLVAVDEP